MENIDIYRRREYIKTPRVQQDCARKMPAVVTTIQQLHVLDANRLKNKELQNAIEAVKKDLERYKAKVVESQRKLADPNFGDGGSYIRGLEEDYVKDFNFRIGRITERIQELQEALNVNIQNFYIFCNEAAKIDLSPIEPDDKKKLAEYFDIALHEIGTHRGKIEISHGEEDEAQMMENITLARASLNKPSGLASDALTDGDTLLDAGLTSDEEGGVARGAIPDVGSADDLTFDSELDNLQPDYKEFGGNVVNGWFGRELEKATPLFQERNKQEKAVDTVNAAARAGIFRRRFLRSSTQTGGGKAGTPFADGDPASAEELSDLIPEAEAVAEFGKRLENSTTVDEDAAIYGEMVRSRSLSAGALIEVGLRHVVKQESIQGSEKKKAEQAKKLIQKKKSNKGKNDEAAIKRAIRSYERDVVNHEIKAGIAAKRISQFADFRAQIEAASSSSEEVVEPFEKEDRGAVRDDFRATPEPTTGALATSGERGGLVSPAGAVSLESEDKARGNGKNPPLEFAKEFSTMVRNVASITLANCYKITENLINFSRNVFFDEQWVPQLIQQYETEEKVLRDSLKAFAVQLTNLPKTTTEHFWEFEYAAFYATGLAALKFPVGSSIGSSISSGVFDDVNNFVRQLKPTAIVDESNGDVRRLLTRKLNENSGFDWLRTIQANQNTIEGNPSETYSYSTFASWAAISITIDDYFNEYNEKRPDKLDASNGGQYFEMRRSENETYENHVKRIHGKLTAPVKELTPEGATAFNEQGPQRALFLSPIPLRGELLFSESPAGNKLGAFRFGRNDEDELFAAADMIFNREDYGGIESLNGFCAMVKRGLNSEEPIDWVVAYTKAISPPENKDMYDMGTYVKGAQDDDYKRIETDDEWNSVKENKPVFIDTGTFSLYADITRVPKWPRERTSEGWTNTVVASLLESSVALYVRIPRDALLQLALIGIVDTSESGFYEDVVFALDLPTYGDDDIADDGLTDLSNSGERVHVFPGCRYPTNIDVGDSGVGGDVDVADDDGLTGSESEDDNTPGASTAERAGPRAGSDAGENYVSPPTFCVAAEISPLHATAYVRLEYLSTSCHFKVFEALAVAIEYGKGTAYESEELEYIGYVLAMIFPNLTAEAMFGILRDRCAMLGTPVVYADLLHKHLRSGWELVSPPSEEVVDESIETPEGLDDQKFDTLLPASPPLDETHAEAVAVEEVVDESIETPEGLDDQEFDTLLPASPPLDTTHTIPITTAEEENSESVVVIYNPSQKDLKQNLFLGFVGYDERSLCYHTSKNHKDTGFFVQKIETSIAQQVLFEAGRGVSNKKMNNLRKQISEDGYDPVTTITCLRDTTGTRKRKPTFGLLSSFVDC